MKIIARKTGRNLIGVEIHENSTSIDLGLLNKEEVEELCGTLLDAIWEMGPSQCECKQWFLELCEKRGIELT